MCFRITLEDDDEDEGLDVESTPRRPVLVISDSLKEGLQRGISDILPHTVAQSVYVLLTASLECFMLNITWETVHVKCFVSSSFFSPGATPAWSWCCGDHQKILSAGSRGTPFTNTWNSKRRHRCPWPRVRLLPLTAPRAHLQTHALLCSACLPSGAAARRRWRWSRETQRLGLLLNKFKTLEDSEPKAG